MTLDLPAIRARAEASRFPRLTSTELLALLAEVERLTRNLELASAECAEVSAYRQLVREEHPAEVAALTAEVERLREALAPFAAFAAKWAAKPIGKARGEDTLYGIHSGTEWEALLTLGDFKRARTALEATRG